MKDYSMINMYRKRVAQLEAMLDGPVMFGREIDIMKVKLELYRWTVRRLENGHK